MRAFVAVELPKEVKDELYRIQKLINPSLAKIKWVPKKNIHLTLKFIGEVKDLKEIHEKLSKIKFNLFQVKLGEFGSFPSWEDMRVFWINLVPPKNIIKLQQAVDVELLKFSDRQDFSPHLTLGRIKVIKREKEFMKLIKSIEVKPIKFNVSEFKLMQSKLSKDGSKFITLKKYKA
jgi:RNA 2',3'-cyclic 3'-phosphodiesterase